MNIHGLTRKGWAWIYCEKVRAIIKEMSEFEFGYLPDGMVAPFSEYPKFCYTHKFDDLDMNDLTALCWQRGIKVWVCDAGHSEFMTDVSKKLKQDASS